MELVPVMFADRVSVSPLALVETTVLTQAIVTELFVTCAKTTPAYLRVEEAVVKIQIANIMEALVSIALSQHVPWEDVSLLAKTTAIARNKEIARTVLQEIGAVQIAVCHVGVTWNAMVLLLDVGCVRMARVRKETSAVKTVQIITIVVEYAQNVILMRRNVLQAVIVEMRVQSIPTALKNPLHVTFAQMESAPLKCRFGIFHRQS